jgi:hypothetical protein
MEVYLLKKGPTLTNANLYSGIVVNLQFSHRNVGRGSTSQKRQSAKLFLQSSELGLPQPLTRKRACPPPPPRFWGDGHTRWRERGWESPYSDEGTYTVLLCIYTYFVIHIIYCFNPLPSGRRTDWPYTHLIDKCSKKA